MSHKTHPNNRVCPCQGERGSCNACQEGIIRFHPALQDGTRSRGLYCSNCYQASASVALCLPLAGILGTQTHLSKQLSLPKHTIPIPCSQLCSCTSLCHPQIIPGHSHGTESTKESLQSPVNPHIPRSRNAETLLLPSFSRWWILLLVALIPTQSKPSVGNNRDLRVFVQG